MKHPITVLFASAAIAIFAALSAATTIRPTDLPELPTIDEDQGVVFTTGDSDRATELFDVLVNFTGQNEQTVTLYEWKDIGDGGRWYRRAFYNSYFQGAIATGAVQLAPHEKFLLVGYQKPAPGPSDKEWTQSDRGPSAINLPRGDGVQPSIEATFRKDQELASITLRPHGAATTQPSAQKG